MRRADGGVRGRKWGFRVCAGTGLVAAAVASSCSAANALRSTPPASTVLSLPGFRVAAPGRSWEREADRESRTAFFAKKFGGPLRFFFDEQRRAEISVTSRIVPPELWETAGETLTSALKSLAAGSAGLARDATWTTRLRRERWFEYTMSAGFIDATGEDLGLSSLSDEPGFKEFSLYALYYPDDLERTHRYFGISVLLTETAGLFRLHEDERLIFLDAIADRLEIVGPFDDLRGPAGALARAVIEGDGEAVRAALDQGAAADAGLPDWTPFELAAACDRRDLAALLGQNGGLAALLADDAPLTPFLLALIAGQSEIAALVLDRMVEPGGGTDIGPPLLALAAGLGDAALVAGLVERGADVDGRAVGGRTPLMLACEAGSPERVEALLEAGAGLDLRSDDGGTALLAAIDWGRADIMRRLIEAGADVSVQDHEGWSALLVAIFQGDAALVGELIAAGADVDANVLATGQTALLLALEGDEFEIAGMLIEAGADVDRHKDGQQTTLMVAAAKGRAELVRLLIDKGADVNIRTDDRRTALSMAEAAGSPAIVEILLKAGARK